MMYKDRVEDIWVTNGVGRVSCVFEEFRWTWDYVSSSGWGTLEQFVKAYGAEVALPEEYMK